MTVCVPDPLLYGLLAAAVGDRFAHNGGIMSLLRGTDGSDKDSSEDKG